MGDLLSARTQDPPWRLEQKDTHVQNPLARKPTGKLKTLQPPCLQEHVPFFQRIQMETNRLSLCFHPQPTHCLSPVKSAEHDNYVWTRSSTHSTLAIRQEKGFRMRPQGIIFLYEIENAISKHDMGQT
jgi:hypothetical protein